MAVRVVLVRHGERLDEANRQEWHQIRTNETKHDPPLTDAGFQHAKAVGKEIGKVVKAFQAETTFTMYSSPTARTLSTASGILSSIDGITDTITPVYVLNCCAAAKCYGVQRAFPKQEPNDSVTRGAKLACWPPLGNPDHIDKQSQNFSDAIKDLASNHRESDLIILVSHREGIWDVLHHVGCRIKAGYCNATYLNYFLGNHSLELWNPFRPASLAPQVLAQMHRHQDLKSQQSKVAAPTTLESVLAQGLGKVVIDRSARDNHRTTSMWRTPGVRGAWVDGGNIPNGEVVQLLSSPQASEGKEGEFVLVRRDLGIEGWIKVCNLHAYC